MSIACNLSVSLPNTFQAVPENPALVGHETLDDFVRIIRLKEKAQAKRARLPELAPEEVARIQPSSFLSRIAKTMFCA